MHTYTYPLLLLLLLPFRLPSSPTTTLPTCPFIQRVRVHTLSDTTIESLLLLNHTQCPYFFPKAGCALFSF